MRSIMIALVLAAGFGLAGTSSSLSAPMSTKVLGDVARAESVTEEVRCRRRCRHYRHSGRRCWRRCWW
jgi:hypothetical protein